MTAKKNYFTISQVVRALSQEYPDLTVSKVRFLESQGLIKPKRTSSGYRQFSQKDIEKLSLILKLQKERYLPLQVIKKRLKAGGEAIPFPEVEAEEVESKEAPYNLEKLMNATGLSEEDIHELESYGLIKKMTLEDEEGYSHLDTQIARLAAELKSFGIEPRHLRIHETFVDREISLLEQILLPYIKQRSAEGKKEAKRLLEKLLKLLNELTRYLLTKSLENRFKELI
jgi:DNA-binding transcriptional MerR regulator